MQKHLLMDERVVNINGVLLGYAVKLASAWSARFSLYNDT